MYQTDALKKLIDKAVAHNFKQDLRSSNDITTTAMNSEEQMGNELTEFFIVLDSLLANALDKQLVTRAKQNKLMLTADHIDSSFDEATIRSCLEKTIRKMEKFDTTQSTELLLKELLKHWKPNQKSVIN